jgi:hypothetical protein
MRRGEVVAAVLRLLANQTEQCGIPNNSNVVSAVMAKSAEAEAVRAAAGVVEQASKLVAITAEYCR